MVADSSSHDSSTTENDEEGEILGEMQGKGRRRGCLHFFTLLETELRTQFFFTKLVCDYAVAIVVVCRDITTLSLVAYISRC